jgi:Phosphoribosylpyrophosphate synthetase
MLFFNGAPVKFGEFPNHETYLDLDDLLSLVRTENTVTMRFEGNDDLINLMLLKRTLDDDAITPVALVVPFLPYSTMDRTEDTRVLSCKYISEFVNALNFSSVSIWEAHSPVVLATLDRVKSDNMRTVKIANYVMNVLSTNGEDLLVVFPDDGARKRYQKAFEETPTVTMEKSRDFITGNITGSHIALGKENIQEGMTAVIVDDLCRAGWTFVKAAEELKKHGVNKVYLCVTHAEEGIFTGAVVQSDFINAVYTTDSCCEKRKHDRIKFVETIL